MGEQIQTVVMMIAQKNLLLHAQEQLTQAQPLNAMIAETLNMSLLRNVMVEKDVMPIACAIFLGLLEVLMIVTVLILA